MAAREPRVGVLGLGRMGLPIARSLARAGFAVSVFDIAADRRTEASPLSAADSAVDLARSVDTLVTVLPGAIEAERLLLDDGLIDEVGPGALWLDLTSSDPTVSRRIAERATQQGIASVAAPMGGGPSAAESGRLRFFAGGEPSAIERATPILAALGGEDAVDRVGNDIGDGGTAKLLANLLWFGQVVAVTEALLLGISLGVPIRSLRHSLGASPGGSVFVDEYLDSLLAGDYLETFGIDRVVEELDILVRLADRADVPFELSRTVARLHREALDRFGAIDGELLAAKLLEERAGIDLRS